MDTSITKQFRFEAAHTLPKHDGKCKDLHGHSYLLEVTITGDIQSAGPKEGMIMDFTDVSVIVDREIISQWDHKFLNDLVSFTTTAENLANEIFARLDKYLPITKGKLWETSKAYVEVVAKK